MFVRGKLPWMFHGSSDRYSGTVDVEVGEMGSRWPRLGVIAAVDRCRLLGRSLPNLVLTGASPSRVGILPADQELSFLSVAEQDQVGSWWLVVEPYCLGGLSPKLLFGASVDSTLEPKGV